MATLGTMHVRVLGKHYTDPQYDALMKLIDEAQLVMEEQMKLGHERDDETAEFLAEGWEESAAYAHDRSEEHWRAMSVIRNLLDELPIVTIATAELKLTAEGVEDGAGRFTLALSESMALRG